MSNSPPKRVLGPAALCKALGQPWRMHIFRTLAQARQRGERDRRSKAWHLCVGDVGKRVALAPSTVSHHIRELKRAGLVHAERRGQHVWCWVDDGAIHALRDVVDWLDRG